MGILGISGGGDAGMGAWRARLPSWLCQVVGPWASHFPTLSPFRERNILVRVTCKVAELKLPSA